MLCVEQHIDPPTFIPLRRRSWGPSNIPPHVGGGTRDEPKERLHRRLSDIKPVSTIDTRIRQSCTRASRPRWATRSDQKTVCRMKKLGVQLIPPGWDSRCAYHLLRKHRKFWLKIQLAHVLSSRTFLKLQSSCWLDALSLLSSSSLQIFFFLTLSIFRLNKKNHLIFIPEILCRLPFKGLVFLVFLTVAYPRERDAFFCRFV